ncbi:proteobacterial dedicated sortase system histidine kinase [Thalassotalea aquiviva]|uniref:proteobacterial dedicated sortase system histidine kinase n=1 Tax=Thalassotalea aquiviva TaxID=3242415 RepID=UPI00352A0333
MKAFRLSLTLKLMFVASFLFAIPFIGYFYIGAMEELLRKGQEQNLMGNARGLATALHERPNLFNKHASYKKKLETGKDFFPTQIDSAIALDGNSDDWQNHITAENTNRYNANNQVKKHDQVEFYLVPPERVSLSYTTHIGRYKDHVYAFFAVLDDSVVYRDKNKISVLKNDHLELATINKQNQLVRYIFTNFGPGWTTAYEMPSDDNGYIFPRPENRIQGMVVNKANGYNIELRIPNELVGEKFGFHITDVDDYGFAQPAINIGTTSTEKIEDLGTFTVPSKQIERIIEASKRTHSSIRVIDVHQRELLQKGSLVEATGAWINEDLTRNKPSFFNQLKDWILDPFYSLYLVKPAKNFISEDFNQRKNQKHILNALKGQPDSFWWKSKDNKAVILSAAHPIYLNNNVEGVVIVEETTHGIRNIRNKAIEGIIITSLLIALSVISLFIYSLWTSLRIRKLRDQVEHAVDEHGRIQHQIKAFQSSDEIGEVSRTFANMIHQLSQYNDYLENMSSRLSHELKTPISIVRSSLEMMEQKSGHIEQSPYMQRAKDGIERLNSMLLAMSEATHLEQALQTSDMSLFNLSELVKGCSLGYQQVYPDQAFNVEILDTDLMMMGSDEHIAQLFDKIISNAVEFSAHNAPINIRLKVDGGHATLVVSNFGSLLPAGMDHSIFDPMVSVRDNTARTTPHLGIGLYICRVIAQFHHGQIKASNMPNQNGVDITVTLPLAKT